MTALFLSLAAALSALMMIEGKTVTTERKLDLNA